MPCCSVFALSLHISSHEICCCRRTNCDYFSIADDDEWLTTELTKTKKAAADLVFFISRIYLVESALNCHLFIEPYLLNVGVFNQLFRDLLPLSKLFGIICLDVINALSVSASINHFLLTTIDCTCVVEHSSCPVATSLSMNPSELHTFPRLPYYYSTHHCEICLFFDYRRRRRHNSNIYLVSTRPLRTRKYRPRHAAAAAAAPDWMTDAGIYYY